MLDFKRSFYLRHYEEQLEKLERAISKKGKNWDEWIKFIEDGITKYQEYDPDDNIKVFYAWQVNLRTQK